MADTTFTVDGKTYEIAYSIELYENGRTPIIATIARNAGALSVADLKALVGYGLREQGGDWVNPGDGMNMAEKLIVWNGYHLVYEKAADALRRDCGFFFATTAAGKRR